MPMLLGHDAVVQPLLRSLRAGRGAHAYLIAGPPHVGKGTLARLLATAVCCPEANAPCGVCSACRRIAADKHPDVELLAPGGLCDESDHDHAKDNSRDIRICQVRRAEHLLSLAPFEGERRVIIIDPAEALNAQSADAFLKTLEEPTARSLIILVTSEPWALSETVRSRCRLVSLGAVPTAEVERLLRDERGVPAEQAALLARLSGGQIGRALAAIDDDKALIARRQQVERVEELALASRTDRFAYAEELAGRFSRNRAEVYAILAVWLDWWRDLLLTAAGAPRGVVNIDRREALAEAARLVEPAAALRVLRAVRETRRDLEANVNPRLALDALMLRLPAGRKGGAAG